MASNKKYWKSEAELSPDNSIVETLKQNEFPEEIPVDTFLGDEQQLASSQTSRRDFLKYVGFSTAAASLAACEGPVHKSIPYVSSPSVSFQVLQIIMPPLLRMDMTLQASW